MGAHWEAGDIQQRFAANAAVGRKQNGEETLSYSGPSSVRPSPSTNGRSLVRNNRMPCYCNTGVASPDSVRSETKRRRDSQLLGPKLGSPKPVHERAKSRAKQ